jgi:cell division protease FtsH
MKTRSNIVTNLNVLKASRKSGTSPGVLLRLSLVLILASIIFLLPSCLPMALPPSGTTINLSEAIALSKTTNISKVVIDTGSSTMTMTAAVTGAPLKITDVNGNTVDVSNGEDLVVNIGTLTVANLQELGFILPADYSINPSSSGFGNIFLAVLPFLLLIGLFYFLIRAGRGAQNQAFNFGRSRARLLLADRPKVTFADVAGAEEAKEDLQEVVEFLKDRWKFQSIGATIPKGILLIGPPGTGKTLLARALAGEAKVPFFSISGSEFVEMFVGVGAARVRDLFAQAKRSAPCIMFIDEIDAVGRQRAGNIPGSHEEREQTLNQILVEMDGFDPNIGVIVLAATNRVDVLDPALLRPGRFDRRVTLERPDTNGRTAILKLHAKDKAMEPDVDFETIAKQTHGFSGADLAELINEAAILAVRRGKKLVGMAELEDSIDRVIAGPERKSLKFRPSDKELTAYHESGHALVARLLPNVDPVHKISIVARGAVGGYTRLLEEDRYFITESQFKDTLATLIAGHAAEELIFNEVSTGPHSDLKQATQIAEKMITDYGMSKKLGLRTFGQTTLPGYLGFGPPENKDYSEETANLIDKEVRDIMENAHQTAKALLQENRPRLVHLAEKLIVKETLESAELDAAFTEPLSETDTQPVLRPKKREALPSGT